MLTKCWYFWLLHSQKKSPRLGDRHKNLQSQRVAKGCPALFPSLGRPEGTFSLRAWSCCHWYCRTHGGFSGEGAGSQAGVLENHKWHSMPMSQWMNLTLLWVGHFLLLSQETEASWAACLHGEPKNMGSGAATATSCPPHSAWLGTGEEE